MQTSNEQLQPHVEGGHLRGLVWPVAKPTTVTLMILLALGIGYWLYKHPSKKK